MTSIPMKIRDIEKNINNYLLLYFCYLGHYIVILLTAMPDLPSVNVGPN